MDQMQYNRLVANANTAGCPGTSRLLVREKAYDKRVLAARASTSLWFLCRYLSSLCDVVASLAAFFRFLRCFLFGSLIVAVVVAAADAAAAVASSSAAAATIALRLSTSQQ